MTDALSSNTKAILLLTAPLITGRSTKPSDLLTPGEYKKLAKHLLEVGAKPADLLTPAADQLLGECHRVIDKARLERPSVAMTSYTKAPATAGTQFTVPASAGSPCDRDNCRRWRDRCGSSPSCRSRAGRVFRCCKGTRTRP